MADHTLVANTNYSALTVANGDRILLSGFRLTLDVVPTQTGVEVTAVGNAGTLLLGSPTNYPLTGWTLRAGTAALLATVPSGTTVGGAWYGGSVNGAYGISTNNGTVSGSVTGGSVNGAYGIVLSNGTVSGSVTGGSAPVSYGINTTKGTVSGSVTGGGVSGSHGVSTNDGTVSGPVTGGSVNGAYGVSVSNGTVTGAITGGSAAGAHAINNNYGSIATLSGVLVDGAAQAIALVGTATNSPSPVLLVRGDNLRCVVPAGFSTIYHVGPINPLATINGSPTLVPFYVSAGVPDIFRGGLIR